ncbi:cyanamide hydratase [Aureobasidium pullulans]|uniref:Cyanamide hydratase n=1 Tax=Aureobasidium pullulans TaxID=5580 RepID=A0A4S9WIY5_AURPU|nr:cyanamide hydratase [Aureobasidium pullulans]
MSLSRSEQIAEYGWTSLPCDPAKWGGNEKYNKEPVPQLCSSISLPDTALVKAAMEHVKQELPEHTFNHSMAIATQQFPSWEFSPETWLLTCLFHDIGTVDKHTHGTLMSFEFYGGYLAMDQLKQFNSPAGQAESVAEAIIRHQDPVETGTITTVGLLIQLATQFDNMGYRAGYVHEDTIKDVVKNYPRRNWSGCFSEKIREEVEVKPWCHTTASTEKFPHDVEHNELMAPYDDSY